jgi:hypothetical protein
MKGGTKTPTEQLGDLWKGLMKYIFGSSDFPVKTANSNEEQRDQNVSVSDGENPPHVEPSGRNGDSVTPRN